MASPAFGSIGTQLQGTGATMNVPAPSGVAVNDILWVTAFIDTTGVTVTGTPSGWTQATDSPVTGPDNHRLVVYWKRADAGDTGASTFDFTLSGSTYRNAACTRFTGAITTGDPWDVTQSAGSNVTQTTTDDVADTTTVADTLLCWTGTNWSGGTWTPPSGFTERRDTGDGVCSSADKAQAAAGSTGAIVGTCTSSDKRCAWMGALKSAAVVVDSSSYSPARLPGRIGPDGRVFLPGPPLDGGGATQAITGDVAETQDNQTSTASGVLGYSGTVAVTQANQTSTATGVLGYSGTVAVTQDNQTSTASGSVAAPGVSGSLAETQDNQTSTATGVLGYTGTSSRTQANQTSSASGTFTPAGISGTAAVTQANQTSTATATLGYSGTVARTQANQTASASGWISITGTVAVTQANQTAAGSGLGAPIDPPPESRTYAVPAYPRTRTIDADTRTHVIPADTRTLTVPSTR